MESEHSEVIYLNTFARNVHENWTQTGDPVPEVTAAPDLTGENTAFTYEQQTF